MSIVTPYYKMKLRTLILSSLIFLTNLVHAQTKKEPELSFSFNNTSFIELVNKIEKATDIRFYFREEWIDSLKLSFAVEKASITEVMEKALLGTSMGYFYSQPDKIYILPNRSFSFPLPSYTKNNNTQDSISNQTELEQETDKKYLKGRETDMEGTIVVGERNKAMYKQRVSIQGKIIDKETEEPMFGATIFFKDNKSGAATDVNGIFNMTVPIGKYSVVFQCLGMNESKYILDIKSSGSFTVKMQKKLTSIEEVTVNAKQSYKRGSNLGLEKISIKTIKELPTLMGEKDVLKISQMLPGIVSVSEGSAGVNVRGGNADQNLFYINEIPIYNTTHLFGFFSAINSSIVNDFTIYKGHVPAKYGGRLSSVFNIETRKGHKDKFFTQGGISPISANIEIEAPIIKEKLSFLLSARSSYSNWILNRMKDPSLRNSKASFSDFAGGVDYQVNESNKIELFAYTSSDFFNLNGLSDYFYSNMGGTVKYKLKLSPKLKSSINIAGTNYNFISTDKNQPSEAYRHEYLLEHYETIFELNWTPSQQHVINFGGSLTNYKLNRGKVEPYGHESLLKPVDLGKEEGIESAIYLDDKFTVSSWLNLYGGIRFSNFSNIGPKQVLLYKDGVEKNSQNIEDSIYFDSRKNVISYQSPEIRVGADFKIGNSNSIKLSYGQMSQYLFMLSNSFSISPTDQWKLVDYHIKPPKSSQVSLGYYRKFDRLGLSFTSEIYYKTATNIIEYKDGVSFLSNPNIETDVLQGNQEAYGVELMLSKETGKLNGWISYTYSRSFIEIDGVNEWDKINRGEIYPSNYDKPHVCNMIVNYKINRRLAISSNMSYSTGRPITLPQAVYYIEDRPYVDYSARNEYRIPDYFRLDMSLTIEGNLRSRKAFHSFWMISVYNLTGRKNAYSVYFRSEDKILKGYKYSVIGVPIFTISWNFKLGNYSNN